MFSVVLPYQWVAIRLPSEAIKIEQAVPNQSIYLGKFGQFNTNHIINRPFNLTWEILEKSQDRPTRSLRLVKASELHADTLLEEAESELNDGAIPSTAADEDDLDSQGLLPNTAEKSNINIFDDPSNQKLTMEEIEALKLDGTGKDLIAKIMASHTTIDRKTAYSLAKYIVRKQKKFMKRFTVLPLDVPLMADWMMNERDFAKVMEIRNEALGLICSWANIHAAVKKPTVKDDAISPRPHCRYLVVDDTGGLIIAALAERMGILYHHTVTPPSAPTEEADEEPLPATTASNGTTSSHNRPRFYNHHQLATSNTLTLIHSNEQPNLSLLRYFNFDPNLPPSPQDPNPTHPLHTHLKPLSWRQLIDPSGNTTYTEPPPKTPEELHAMKSNARSTYHRKRRRWERCKSIVDEARAGDFNGLVVATHTDPTTVLRQLVPLLAGGAQIVVYSPYIQPLMTLVDAYSTARRTAYLAILESERAAVVPSEDFPVDPTLTLGFMVQTATVEKWQTLPGRTHPLMTGKGGARGYVAVATRVLPVSGQIRARGTQGRGKPRARLEDQEEVPASKGGELLKVDGNSSSDEEEGDKKRIKLAEGAEDVDMVVDDVVKTGD